MRRERRQTGATLVELILFIVIVSVAVAGVLGALNVATKSSSDPLIQKQALAIAESLLEEIELMPYTYCDPDDAQAATAQSSTIGVTGCAVTIESTTAPAGGGPEGNPETRYSATFPFDNVNDYNGFSMAGITDITGTAIPALTAYTATVNMVQQALGAIPAAQSLLITVTVTGPANTTVRLQGYRTRYAPNSLP